MLKAFLLILLTSVSVFARLTDNQIQIKVESNKINITANKGFHLNAEAPASAVFDDLEALFKPETKTEKLISFKALQNAKTAQVSFYVCDDKKTVCEQHKENVLLLNTKTEKTKAIETKETKEKTEQAVLDLKSKNGKPTLLTFSAPWCPACIRMQTETYNKDGVKKVLKQINFNKLNSDLAENAELSEKFGIKAIPTIILLDKDGREAFRWLDFQEPKDFAKSLSAEIKKIDQLGELLKKAEMGDEESAKTLGQRALNALDYAGAVKWFSFLKKPENIKLKLSAEVSLASENLNDKEETLEEYYQVLQKAIVLSDSQLDRLRWTSELFEKKKEKNQLTVEAKAKVISLKRELEELLAKPETIKKSFVASTYGDYGAFETAELLYLKAKLCDLLDDKVAKAANDAESIKHLSAKKWSVDRPGELLLAIAYMREAGETKKVEDYYKQLTKKYSATYVYFEKYSRFLQKHKRNDEALQLIEVALKYPEGNIPQLNLLKSQILKDLNKKDEAIAVIEKTLGLPEAQHKKFKRVVKRLTDLKTELTK